MRSTNECAPQPSEKDATLGVTMAKPLLDYELTDSIAVITMDDGKANALSSPMMMQLDDALSRAQKEAKAVVLAGRPGRFCAGFDLKVMMSGPENARALVAEGAALLLRIYQFPRPFVVACTGHAVAGGALVLLSGDTRIGVAGEFKLGLNEVAIGMTVPILAQELARDRLAPTNLTEAVLQSRMYDPQQAVAVGFLDEVVDGAALMATVMGRAATLAKLPDKAYAQTKRRLRESTTALIRRTLDHDLVELTDPG